MAARAVAARNRRCEVGTAGGATAAFDTTAALHAYGNDLQGCRMNEALQQTRPLSLQRHSFMATHRGHPHASLRGGCMSDSQTTSTAIFNTTAGLHSFTTDLARRSHESASLSSCYGCTPGSRHRLGPDTCGWASAGVHTELTCVHGHGYATVLGPQLRFSPLSK